ncbi:uncharacterized protein CMC5_029340 [Chondromyces crocatus]|uniref:RNA polymerase sigma factor n=1 Tax=Chondromyces crocatus TaxID=52 RepID=A0A0K1EDX7_CHOCO|nr:uncharacterized protein CMC5_029340 [Chondromyces crocatus]
MDPEAPIAPVEGLCPQPIRSSGTTPGGDGALAPAADEGSGATLAFTQEVRSFVVAYLSHLGVMARDVEDVAHNVLMVAWRRRADFDPDKGSAHAWLAGIAHSIARNYHRHLVPRRNREHARPLDDATILAMESHGPHPEEHAIATSRAAFLGACLEAIPPVQRRIIEARDLQGQTYGQIAAELHMPDGTVRDNHRRAWARLRQACARWQALQRRRGLSSTPLVLAPFLMLRDAWAARRSWLSKVVSLAAVGAAGLGWSPTDLTQRAPGAPWPADALTMHPASQPTEALGASLVERPVTPSEPDPPTVAPTPPSLPPPSLPPPSLPSSPSAPPRSPETWPHRQEPLETAAARPREARSSPPELPSLSTERKLMQEARAALLAGNRAVARRLLERHARRFPEGHHAGERRTLLRTLSEPSAS